METLREFLENNSIRISLQCYDAYNIRFGWDVKAIIEHPEVFADFYSRFPLSSLTNQNDYFLYLLSIKFASLSEMCSELQQEEHKALIARLSDNAQKTLSAIGPRDVIQYINSNFQDVFESEKTSHDMRKVTLDIIAKYQNGIGISVFEFLCKNCGVLLIDRFEQFERVFEQHPDLFDLIYRYCSQPPQRGQSQPALKQRWLAQEYDLLAAIHSALLKISSMV